MHLEPGKAYRARTAFGGQIAFTVLDAGDGVWALVDLDSADEPEPNVWLNTSQLLWVSTETHRGAAITRAADEVIEALEQENDK
jgi:hypothetical protein